MKRLLSDKEAQEIAETIRAVESRTQGEVVTVIARSADGYRFIPLLWSALAALLLPSLLVFLQLPWSVPEVSSVQVVVFCLLALLFNLPGIKMRMIPRAVKDQRAHRLALAQFVEQGVHLTRDHTGVLIFVSVAEHYVEIIADKGINDSVPEGYWQTTVNNFIQQIKGGDYHQGFVQTVEACGKYLIEKFPANKDNPDELPNRLIQL